MPKASSNENGVPLTTSVTSWTACLTSTIGLPNLEAALFNDSSLFFAVSNATSRSKPLVSDNPIPAIAKPAPAVKPEDSALPATMPMLLMALRLPSSLRQPAMTRPKPTLPAPEAND